MLRTKNVNALILSLSSSIALSIILGNIMAINGYTLLHIILHVIGIILALFLLIISLAAYNRVRNSRFVILFLGFLGFMIVQIVNLLYAYTGLHIHILNIDLSHILDVYILMLLVLAILKDKRYDRD